jgi:hypothetical protein
MGSDVICLQMSNTTCLYEKRERERERERERGE